MKLRPIEYDELINFIKTIAVKKKCKIHFQNLTDHNINPGVEMTFKGLKITINKYFNIISIGSYRYEIPSIIKSEITGHGYVLQSLSSYLYRQQQRKFTYKGKKKNTDKASIELYYSILKKL